MLFFCTAVCWLCENRKLYILWRMMDTFGGDKITIIFFVRILVEYFKGVGCKRRGFEI